MQQREVVTGLAAFLFAATGVVAIVACSGNQHPEPELHSAATQDESTPLPAVHTATQPVAASPQHPDAPFDLPASIGNREAATQGRELVEVLRPLTACAEIRDRLPNTDEEYYDARARATGDIIEVWMEFHGNGVGHSEAQRYLVARPSNCTAVAITLSYTFESWLTWARFEGIGVASPGPDARLSLARAQGQSTERFAPSEPRFGAGRMKISARGGRRDEESDWAVAPFDAEQPELPGRPIGGPGLYFEIEELRALHLIPPGADDDDEGPAPQAVLVGQTQTPQQLLEAGDHSLFQAPVGVRQRAALVATYDRSRDRHRWACLIPVGVPRWLGVRQGLAIASAETEHPVFAPEEAVYAVDLRRGRCHVIVSALPNAEEESGHRFTAVRLSRDALELSSLGSMLRIPIRELRSRIDAASGQVGP
jgi:hypothetical protein